MKNILKKNQLMITALAIMIAIAGYLQYAENTMKDENGEETKAVDSGKVITENFVASSIREDGVALDEFDGLLDLSEEDLETLGGIMGIQAGETGEIASLDSDLNVITEDYLEDGMDLVYENANGDAVPDEGEIPGEAVLTSAGVAILADAKLLKEQTRARNKATLLELINNEFVSEDQKQQAINSMVEMTRIAEKEAAAEILLEAKGFSDVVVSISDDGVDVVVNAVSLSDAQRAQIEDIVRRKTEVSAENIIISTVVKD